VPTHRFFKAKVIFGWRTPGATAFREQSQLCWGMGLPEVDSSFLAEVGTMLMMAEERQ
jgi:hypothetical protein